MKQRKPEAPAIVSPKPRQTVPFKELSPEQKKIFLTPSLFGKKVLGYDLTPEQSAVCDAFKHNRAHVAAKFCNEGGKTTRILPTIILWHITIFPRRGDNGGVTATSGSWSQIENQLMPALIALAPKFPYWDFQSHAINRDGFPNLMAYSTAKPGRAEGFHGQPTTPLMMLFDECKSVPDNIIKAGEDRCRPQRLGLVSSTGFAMGKFYEAFNKEKDAWNLFSVGADKCPWIDRIEMERVIARAGGGDYQRGLLDPFIRSAYFAEFMPFVVGSLLSLEHIQGCLNDPPQFKPGEWHVRCDFARGGDENAIGARRGNRVWLQKAWRERDTMAAAAEFVRQFEELKKSGCRPQDIEGDADGLGGPIVDAIRSMGWPILEYHANAPAFDSSKYKNRESENWFEGAQKIERKEFILCDDEEMKVQMVDRKTKADPSGLRWIESKKELFARQSRDGRPTRSPDRAEVIFGAMADKPSMESMNFAGTTHNPSPWVDDPDIGPTLRDNEPSIPAEVLRGFDAG